MTDRTYQLALQIDAGLAQATRELETVDKALDAIEGSGRKAGAGLKETADAADKAAPAVKRTKDAAKEASTALDSAADSGRKAGAGLKETAAAADKAAPAVKRTKDAAKDASTALDDVADSGRKAGAGLKETSAGAAAEAAALEKSNARRERLAALINSARGQRLLEAEAIRKGTTEIGKQTISVGQYNAAMRMLPAQMTDITVGLATGQSPFMVLMQQGGQLKDMFGGIGPAMRAVAGQALKLVNPLTLAAGSAALLGKAWLDAQDEAHAFDLALIQSGNYAGQTSESMAALRDRLDQIKGVTRGGAADALTQVAESGKFAGTQFEQVARAAARMQASTGTAVEATVSAFAEIAKDPVQTLLKLNESEHFLTEAQIRRIEKLVDEKQKQEAVAEAITIYSGHLDEVATKADAALPGISRWWRGIKDDTSAAYGTLETYMGLLDKAIQRQQQLNGGTAKPQLQTGTLVDLLPKGWVSTTAALAKQLGINFLSERAGVPVPGTAAAKAAAAPATAGKPAGTSATVDTQAEKDRLEAQKKWASLVESNLSKQEKLEKEIRDIRVQGVAAGKSDAEIQAQIAQANARYKESLPKAPKGQKTETQKDQEAAARELENLTKQVALTGQLEDGQKKASEAARIRYEIDQGAYKLADASTKQQLLQQAQLLDVANARTEADRKMLEVRQQIAALSGGKEDGEILKARRELEQLQASLLKQGRTSDAADVAKLLNLKQASTDLANLRQQYDQVMGGISLEAQRIQVEQQAGLITEADAQQKIVDLYRSKLGTLRELVPQMRAAATALGDEQALANVDQIELKLKEMSATTNLLQQTVRSTFQDSFKGALDSLIDGTASLGEAVQNFFVSMVQGMAQFVAQDWAQKATGWLMSKAGGLLGGDTAADAAQVTSATTAAGITTGAATTSALTITTAASTAAATMSQGIGAAAAALVQSAIAAASILQAQSTAKGIVTVGSAIMTKASGGHILGPGTDTSDSIPAWLSNYEYVTRASVVRQPGALSFLHDFNRRGMAALHDRRAFAVGGLVTAPMASASPRASVMSAAEMGGTVNNRMRVYMYQDIDQLRSAILNHPAAEKKIVATAGENGQAIRAEW